MKNPFKKKPKVEPVEAPKPTVIQTVLGYKVDGALYETIDQAKGAAASGRMTDLVTGWFDNYYNEDAFIKNFAAIKALVNEEITVLPLEGTTISGTGFVQPTYQTYSWFDELKAKRPKRRAHKK
jgi:hypothetical protein